MRAGSIKVALDGAIVAFVQANRDVVYELGCRDEWLGVALCEGNVDPCLEFCIQWVLVRGRVDAAVELARRLVEDHGISSAS